MGSQAGVGGGQPRSPLSVSWWVRTGQVERPGEKEADTAETRTSVFTSFTDIRWALLSRRKIQGASTSPFFLKKTPGRELSLAGAPASLSRSPHSGAGRHKYFSASPRPAARLILSGTSAPGSQERDCGHRPILLCPSA